MTSGSIALWAVRDGALQRIQHNQIDREQRLEEWIESSPDILGERLLLIGRQVPTKYGGRVDLLAVDGDGQVVVIELKKGKTPREIVAQLLDYVSWAAEVSDEQLRDIAARTHRAPFDELFKRMFYSSSVPTLNSAQRGLIVATDTDEATTRIIQHLTRRHGMDINVVTLSFFVHEGSEMLARWWTVAPAELAELVAPPPAEARAALVSRSWTGFWHVNVGVHADEHIGRNWEDPRQFGFLSAGQGPQWRDAIKNLSVGDKVFAYLNGHGYVGAGTVVSAAVPAREFVSPIYNKPLHELPLLSQGWFVNCDDADNAEYVVGIDWTSTRDAKNAVRPSGAALRGTAVRIHGQDRAAELIAAFKV
jgi:hypothetical protein